MNQQTERITILGRKLGRQPHSVFGIRQADRLFHQYVIGQTGTGKSTLLLNMIRQDIAAGQGFGLIDPHGDLAASVAEAAGADALVWNAADPASPYGYNPLTYVTDDYRPLVASGLIDTLKKQWADAWGARMEHLLRHSILALLERSGSTLDDIIPMFLDKSFRQRVLATVKDAQVRRFWTVEYPAMSFKNAADGVAPIANKLGAFLAHPVVRNAVCKPREPLRFRKLIDEGQVLIVNLAKGRLGADVSNILGGLIVSSIAHAAYSRQDQPENERRPSFLYIDEFHSFTTQALADMLSELRKYGLGLALAHQHTTQLDPKVLEAILGNVGTLMAFRLGATDAKIMARQIGANIPSERDLVNLPNYEMYLKLMIKETQSKAFSARSIFAI
ncbi:MAG: type IV secretion system DNA-binding domain-containing protein [Rhizobiaceae bacterium]